MKHLLQNQLEGRTAIITGANQGLGLEIAKAFVNAGANVMLCARSVDLLMTAQNELRDLARDGQRIVAMPADVSNQSDVLSVSEATLKEFGTCHILVNNAGVYGPKGDIEDVDWHEWMRAIEVNVFGSVMMCREMIRHFKTQRYGKIIQLSGGGATSPLPGISAYAASKTAIVTFAESLAEEVREAGIDVNCIAPGPLNTRMLDEVIAAGPDKVGQDFYSNSLKQKESGGAPLKLGAQLAVFLASAKSDGITGKLISALWDNWENWPEHLDELSKSDVYTLRRIRGRDRGSDWGDR